MGILEEYERIAAKHDIERCNTGMAIRLGEAFCQSLGRRDPAHQFELAVSCVPDSLKDKAQTCFNLALEICESPIEKLLLPWLICQEYSFFEHTPLVLVRGELHKLSDRSVALIPQLPIGRYRVDFALAARRGGQTRFVIIECDGEEFHQDVHKDINRDAKLLSYRQVLDVVSVSGKDICKDARAAALGVAKAFAWAWSKNNISVAWKFA
jgi:very-short-patch-repair endonuclease